jgi:hypothetical protein
VRTAFLNFEGVLFITSCLLTVFALLVFCAFSGFPVATLLRHPFVGGVGTVIDVDDGPSHGSAPVGDGRAIGSLGSDASPCLGNRCPVGTRRLAERRDSSNW